LTILNNMQLPGNVSSRTGNQTSSHG